jgi:hypothetical protein
MSDTGKPYVCEIMAKIADPEAYNAEVYRVRLKGVQFTGIPVMNFEVGSLVEEEWEFQFSGFEIVDAIHGDTNATP